MSGLFKSQRTFSTQLAGVNLQTSSYGGVLSLLYGTTRAPANMVDYDDFTTNSSTQRMGKGGSKSTTYSYTVGAILAICEGPITGLNRVWCDGSENFASYYSLTVLNGSRPQTPWSIWTSLHPAKAIGYAGMALACNDSFNLGDTGTMSQWAFEVKGLLATEPDTNSLITVGLGTGSQTAFFILDLNGNQITDSTTPPWSGYISPTFYVNGAQVFTGFTIAKNVNGAYQIQFSTPPVLNAVIAWSMTQSVMNDAMPSNILVDFLTNGQHGVGWNSARISSLITGCPFSSSASARVAWMNANPASWQTYCTAMGFAVSPLFDSQKAAAEHIRDLLTATNSEAVWSAGPTSMQLNVIPFGDTPVSGSGVAYVPPTAPLYSLGYDDFMGVVDEDGQPTGDDPVAVSRKDPADIYNIIPVEWWDRMAAYNASTVQDSEPVDVAQRGPRVGSSVTLHMITRRAHALALSRILAQQSVYLRNQYTFKVGWKYILLEPMDLVALTDPKLGISNLIVRILSVDFPQKIDEAEGITIVAEAWPFGVGTPTVYVSGATSSPSLSQQIPPGNVLETVIFNVPALATETGNPEVIVAACGGQYWGGCEVWLSYDNTTYSQIGVIQGQCRCGTLTGTLASTSTGYPAQDTASSLQIIQGCSYQRNLSTISAGVAADQ